MEGTNSDLPKILESIFLCKLLICRSKTDKIKYPETFKAKKNVDESSPSFSASKQIKNELS